MSDPKIGLIGKYRVERVDGKPLKGGRCIVLELGDPNTWDAMLTWADTVERKGYKALAIDVRAMVNEARGEQEAEPTVDSWPDEAAMAESCGCGHTLGQHEYGTDLAPCEHCPCRDFHSPGSCAARGRSDVCEPTAEPFPPPHPDCTVGGPHPEHRPSRRASGWFNECPGTDPREFVFQVGDTVLGSDSAMWPVVAVDPVRISQLSASGILPRPGYLDAATVYRDGKKVRLPLDGAK